MTSFHADLAFSNSKNDMWLRLYKQAFPDFKGIVRIDGDCVAQRQGIDCVIALANGNTVTVDEKLVRSDSDAFFIEWQAHGMPGWAEKKLSCDYIAYGFAPSEKAFLFPYQQFKRAWAKHGASWKRANTRTVRETNTHGAIVPIDVMLDALREALVLQ